MCDLTRSLNMLFIKGYLITFKLGGLDFPLLALDDFSVLLILLSGVNVNLLVSGCFAYLFSVDLTLSSFLTGSI